MDKLQNAAKGYFLAFILFLVTTFLGAVLLRFTAFPEKWGFFYLLCCMTLCCVILAYKIAYFWEKAGLLCGLASSIGFLILVIAVVCGSFREMPGPDLFTPFYFIPIAAGSLGGIFGANGKK